MRMISGRVVSNDINTTSQPDPATNYRLFSGQFCTRYGRVNHTRCYVDSEDSWEVTVTVTDNFGGQHVDTQTAVAEGGLNDPCDTVTIMVNSMVVAQLDRAAEHGLFDPYTVVGRDSKGGR